MSEKTFDELKVEAKELGVKFLGKELPELEKEIEEAKVLRAQVMAEKEAQKKELEAKKLAEKEAKKLEKTFNTVVIYNGMQEIRTYSLAIHGKEFANLATSFATERGYRMELIDTGKNITCPSCGHSFAPRVK